MSPLTFRLPLGRKSICRYDSGVKGLILTREDWVESSESVPGVNLRCRKPLGATFDPDEGKAVFDNRLCIEGKKTVGEPTKCVWLLPCQNKTTAVLQVKENSAPFLKAGRSLELCMLDLAFCGRRKLSGLRSSPSPLSVLCCLRWGLQRHFYKLSPQEEPAVHLPHLQSHRSCTMVALTQDQFHQTWTVASVWSGQVCQEDKVGHDLSSLLIWTLQLLPAFLKKRFLAFQFAFNFFQLQGGSIRSTFNIPFS